MSPPSYVAAAYGARKFAKTHHWTVKVPVLTPIRTVAAIDPKSTHKILQRCKQKLISSDLRTCITETITLYM